MFRGYVVIEQLVDRWSVKWKVEERNGAFCFQDWLSGFGLAGNLDWDHAALVEAGGEVEEIDIDLKVVPAAVEFHSLPQASAVAAVEYQLEEFETAVDLPSQEALFQEATVVMAAGFVSPAVEAEAASAVDIGREVPWRRLRGGSREDRQSLISVGKVVMRSVLYRQVSGYQQLTSQASAQCAR